MGKLRRRNARRSRTDPSTTNPASFRVCANTAKLAPKTEKTFSSSRTATMTEPSGALSTSLIAVRPASVIEAPSSRTRRIVIAGPSRRVPVSRRISWVMCARRPSSCSVASATFELDNEVPWAPAETANATVISINLTLSCLSEYCPRTWRDRSDVLLTRHACVAPPWAAAKLQPASSRRTCPSRAPVRPRRPLTERQVVG